MKNLHDTQELRYVLVRLRCITPEVVPDLVRTLRPSKAGMKTAKFKRINGRRMKFS